MLTKPLAVMVNRGGENLDRVRAVADSIGWPRVGEDPEDLVLSDAGGPMIGLGFQQRQQNVIDKQCCSKLFLDAVPIGTNTASELEIVPANFNDFVARAANLSNVPQADLNTKVLRTRDGMRLSFFDVNGNLTTLTSPSAAAVAAKAGPVGAKLNALLARRKLNVGAAPGARQADNPAPVVGLTLLVSDVRASVRFYRDILGLPLLSMPVLRALQREAKLDAGPIILTLRNEPHIGTVTAMRASKLLRDQIIFHAPDIQAEVKNLTDRGVAFPEGIEGSISAGQVAHFNDPDGHNLWLWQPPDAFGPDMRIDYFPTLRRILQENG